MKVSIVPRKLSHFFLFSCMLIAINTSGCNWRKSTELTPENVAAVEKWIQQLVIPRSDGREHGIAMMMRLHTVGGERMVKLIAELGTKMGRNLDSGAAPYSLKGYEFDKSYTSDNFHPYLSLMNKFMHMEGMRQSYNQDEKFRVARDYFQNFVTSIWDHPSTTNESMRLTTDLMVAITEYRPFWKSDQFQQSEWDLRLARIPHDSDSAIGQWRQPLADAKKTPISQFEVVLHLIDIESLFTQKGIDSGRSQTLVGRLKGLRQDNTFALAQAMNVSPSWSGVLMIQNDAFFTGDKFQQGVFDDALGHIRAKLAPPKK